MPAWKGEAQAGGERNSRNVPPVATNLPMQTEKPRASEILENTPNIKQARKTGKVSKATKQLANLALDDRQTVKFHEFPEQTQNKLVQESPEVLKQMLAVEGFGAKQAEALLGYSPKTRAPSSPDFRTMRQSACSIRDWTKAFWPPP